MSEEKMQLFGRNRIRSVWDGLREEWYFSVVDAIGVLTEQVSVGGARNYWKVLKNRLKEEGSELVTNCNQLKMTSADGKKYKTDVMTTEQILYYIVCSERRRKWRWMTRKGCFMWR